MTIDTYRSRVLLALFAAAVLTAGLLTLVETTPAWSADRSFEPATSSPFPVGSSPGSVTNADFDGDGHVDLATSNFDSNNVSVLLGDGGGDFSKATNSPFAVGTSPTSVASADLNDDGFADLAVANRRSNNVSVLLGNGDGDFPKATDASYAIFAVGTSPTSVTTGHFNADSFVDLAVSNYGTGSVSILLGQDLDGDGKSDGTFKPHTEYPIYTETCNDFLCVSDTGGPNQVIVADFNGDAKADLATANLGICFLSCATGGVSVLLGNGDGTFQDYKLAPNDTPITSIDVTGSADIVATEYNNHVVKMLLGNGNGTFSAGQEFSAGTNPWAVTSADLNGDSVDDLAVANLTSDNVSVLWGNGGNFQAAQNFPAGDGPDFVVGADLNSDKFADLAVANQNSNNVSVLLNTQPPPPPPETTITSGPPEDQVVNSTSATFGFTSSEPGSTFQCSLDNPHDSAYSPCTSPQTVPEEGSLAEGSHTFYVKATGASGTDPTPATRTWKVDATAPTINNVSPSDQSQNISLGANVEATFSETMNASTLTISTFTLTKQNSSTPVSATVSYSSTTNKATLNPSSDLASNATYTATIEGGSTGAKDSAGNALAQDYSWSFTTAADTTAPNTTIVSGPSGNVRSTSASFSFSSSEAGSTFQCSRDGSAFAACTSPKSYPGPLGQGSHTFKVQAKDAAGNTDATPATRSWFVDSVVPRGTIFINGGNASTASRSVTLKLSASDPAPASGVASMRFRNGNTTTWSGWFDYSTSKSWTLSAGAGTKTVYVQYRDRAVNISAAASDTIRFSP